MTNTFTLLENDELVTIVKVTKTNTMISEILFFKDSDNLTQYAQLTCKNGKTNKISWGSSTTLLRDAAKTCIKEAKEFIISQGIAEWKEEGYSSVLVFK